MYIQGLKAQVAMPGSCGELVQGTLDGINFHITWPVNRYSVVSAWPTTGEIRVAHDLKNTATLGTAALGDAKTAKDLEAGDLEKTTSAVEKALKIVQAELDIEIGAEIEVKTELAPGKGMASSTADIAAAVLAVYRLFDKSIETQKIAEIALSIEPTDGTFFEGIVAFDHLEGKLFERIGEAPPVELVVLEPPQTLDTVSFNRQKPAVKDDILIKEAYEMAVSGIRTANLKLIGEAATLSAILNQSKLTKPELNDVIELCRRKGALGVNVAHSGTVMGILVEQGFGDKMFDKIAHYVPRAWQVYVAGVIGGSARVPVGEGFELLNQPVNR